MKNYGPMNPRSRIEYMKEIDVMAYQRYKHAALDSSYRGAWRFMSQGRCRTLPGFAGRLSCVRGTKF